MRRFFALIPALALLLALAPAAHANTPPSPITSDCLRQSPGQDPGPVTATATWTNTSDPNQHLLTGLTVDDSCHKFWVELRFRTSATDANAFFYFWVQPGAHHTFTQAELQGLGIYQRPFYRWLIHGGWNLGRPKAHLTNDCPPPPTNLIGYVLADGSFLSCQSAPN
jgi:hypothetical protein